MTNNPLSQSEIAVLSDATAAHLNRPARPISVSFVDEAKMTELNQAHRRKAGPTDVLSFPFDDGFPHGESGEVVICPEVAARNADQRGTGFRDELAMLVVHGALHIYGHEDETDQGRDEMDRLTRLIMEDVWSGTSA